MAIYSSAANNDAGNLAGSPTVIHCIIPNGSIGMSLLEWYTTQDETGAIGGRMSLIAATGGTSSEALTPEKLSTRSGAAGFTTQTKFSAEPTTSGNRLVTMGYDADTTRISHRRWMIPNPRYPIYRDPGDAKLCINVENSAQVTFTRYLVVAEDRRSSFDTIRGRRGRTRGYFMIQDEARNFGGVSTAPKINAGANGYIALQTADWDTGHRSSLATFLNLLNAATGDLQVDGAIAGASVVSGTLSVTKDLAGAIAGASVVAGVLSVAETVAGAIAGASVVSGTLALSEAVTGAIAGASVVSGLLTVSKAVAGAITGGSVVAGALSVLKDVAGALAGASAVSGTLSVTKNVAGAIAGGSAVSGDITLIGGTDLFVAGAIAGGSSVSGSIIENAAVAGAIAGASVVSGDLSVSKTVAGAIAGSSSVSGSILEFIDLTGLVAGGSSVSGTLSVSKSVAGAIAGRSVVAGVVTGGSATTTVTYAIFIFDD